MGENLREKNIDMLRQYIQNGVGDKESIVAYARTVDSKGFIALVNELETAYNGFVDKSITGEYPIFEINEHDDESRDISELYTELAKLPNAPVERLADAVISSEDIYWIYVFARDIKGAPVDKLANALIDLLKENFFDAGVLAEYMYYFANDVQHAPINKLAIAVLSSEDVFKDSEACGYLDEFSNLVAEPLSLLLKFRYEQAKQYHGDYDKDDEDESDDYDEFDEYGYDDIENE